MMFTLLDFLRKVVPTATMESAIWRGESVKIWLVPHWTTMFCTDNGSGKLMACQTKFSTGSPPVPKFIAFSNTICFFHTIWYHASPAIIESPNRRVLGFVIFIVTQCMRLHSIEPDFLERPRAIKASKNFAKRKADFHKNL